MVVSQYTQPGALIGRVTANDIDQNENAEVEYDGSSATGSQYYKVMKNGQIYLTREINFEYGMTHRVYVTAVDHGSPQLTGTSYVDIVYRETSTTSTTTAASTYQDWWSKPENVAMVAILSILGLLLLALLAYLIYRCCLGRSCSMPKWGFFKIILWQLDMFDAYYIHEKCSMVYPCTFYLYISMTELFFVFFFSCDCCKRKPSNSLRK